MVLSQKSRQGQKAQTFNQSTMHRPHTEIQISTISFIAEQKRSLSLQTMAYPNARGAHIGPAWKIIKIK